MPVYPVPISQDMQALVTDMFGVGQGGDNLPQIPPPLETNLDLGIGWWDGLEGWQKAAILLGAVALAWWALGQFGGPEPPPYPSTTPIRTRRKK